MVPREGFKEGPPVIAYLLPDTYTYRLLFTNDVIPV
jgi:hypothetical protein